MIICFSNYFLIVMKPFAELSMVKRLLEHSNVQQFRYFKVLIQEFHVKVDIIFINAIVGLFEANEMNDVEEVSSIYFTCIKYTTLKYYNNYFIVYFRVNYLNWT